MSSIGYSLHWYIANYFNIKLLLVSPFGDTGDTPSIVTGF